MNQKQKIPVSIVIPTLGGSSLLKIIKLLNESVKIPEEILICIPKEQKYDNLIKNFQLVKLLEKKNKVNAVYGNIDGRKIRSCFNEYLYFICENICVILMILELTNKH